MVTYVWDYNLKHFTNLVSVARGGGGRGEGRGERGVTTITLSQSGGKLELYRGLVNNVLPVDSLEK